MIEKKSIRTKNSLLDAMWELILEGDKVISVAQLMVLSIVTIKILIKFTKSLFKEEFPYLQNLVTMNYYKLNLPF